MGDHEETMDKQNSLCLAMIQVYKHEHGQSYVDKLGICTYA